MKVIEEAHPDIYVKGGDYRIEDLPEASLVASWGGRTVTVEFEHHAHDGASQKSTRRLIFLFFIRQAASVRKLSFR